MTSNIGHNNPPDMAVTSSEVLDHLNEWMKEHPVVQTEEEAREAKVYIDRAKLCIKDLEAERTQKVKPLNDQVKEINDHYRGPKDTLQKTLNEVERRVTAFLAAEERRRLERAEKARLDAEAAERAAREAERIEQERIDAARNGELGVSIADASRNADQQFSEYERASRFADRAERETKVKVSGGLGRAVSLRSVETLVLVNPLKAIESMGITDDIREAILKSARAYRKQFDELPDGVEVQIERKI